MMNTKRLLIALSLLCFGLTATVTEAKAQTNNDSEVFGYWLTANERSVIKTEPCANDATKLCGHVHWIIDGGMQYDTKNPDETKRTQPMCRLPILTDFKKQSQDTWGDGKIYKADEGDTYNATAQLLPSGKLLVRGYIGMPLFGKSQQWTSVSLSDYPACQKP